MVQATIQPTSTTSSRTFIFVTCLLFRFLNAYYTRTYDNPDEYWQGQEIAHELVFGNGYLTWEWREKIRSFSHPLTIAIVYKTILLLGLQNTHVIVAAPRYFQATLAAVADVATYTLAKKVIGNDIALSMLFTTLCSWFNFQMAARTLSNSMEMVFTIIALNYWPLPGIVKTTGKSWVKNYRISLVFASIACVMRPTNGLIWLFLGVHLLLCSSNVFKVAYNALFICILVIALDVMIDTRLYNHSWSNFTGSLVFTPYLFFKVNVVNNVSLFYGVHTWHWYISQGIPFIFTTFLPMIGVGLYRICTTPMFNRFKSLLYLSAWVIIIYSLLPHKEFRFIFPIVPLILMIAAYGIQQAGSSRWRKRIILFLVFTQLPMALYTSIWHQRGVMDVMLWMRSQPKNISVGVLMPCHSTPWYSIIHDNIPMWFLTCDPPLVETSELDEADQFYANPTKFLETHQQDRVWPTTHLILFDNLIPEIREYLDKQGYRECQRFFNSYFHDDKRRRGDVVVFCQ
ncbi:Alg9-like mannosyltransferase family-domain-containing protein, partial [Parasitella parasitica]